MVNMIKIIMGLKGTGKTKALINEVNNAVKEENGDVICIEKGTKLRYDVSHSARLISASEYKIDSYEKFFGFISGLIAGNYDITAVYIDSITKICNDNNSMEDLTSFIESINHIAEHVNIVITISYDINLIPEALKPYI
jgi:hypothetical protein